MSNNHFFKLQDKINYLEMTVSDLKFLTQEYKDKITDLIAELEFYKNENRILSTNLKLLRSEKEMIKKQKTLYEKMADVDPHFV